MAINCLPQIYSTVEPYLRKRKIHYDHVEDARGKDLPVSLRNFFNHEKLG